MRAGLEAWARDRGATLALEDDRSDPALAARLHAELRGTAAVSCSARTGAIRRGRSPRAGGAVWNHGAAADDVQRLPGVASIPRPASRYLVAVGRAVAALRPGARTAVAAAPGRFARFAREGFEREAATLGLELVAEPADADAVLLCGPFEWELERLRTLPRTKLLGGVSPGLTAIAERLDPEGLIAPVQWHPDLGGPPGLEDYVAGQAYAAAADRRALPGSRGRARPRDRDVLRRLPARSRRAPGRARAVRRPVARRPPRAAALRGIESGIDRKRCRSPTSKS